MNLFSKIFICLIVFLCEPLFAQIGFSVHSEECKADLSIESDINEVNIYIDNKLAGGGKNFHTKIDTGFHFVGLLETTKRWDSKSFLDTIHITSCNEVVLNYKFMSEVLLDSDPQNALVYSGDSLVGYTPLLVKPDFKSLLLEKSDYLEKSITPYDIKTGGKITLDFIGKEKEKIFFNTPWSKILIGTAVALGAVTAYVKLKADDKFEEYQVTGDPALLDETDRLDIISGATFVALQVNVGLIVYLFLSD